MRAPAALGEFAAATTRGGRRLRNEDAIAAAGTLFTGEVTNPAHGTCIPGQRAAFVVSDGVGGEAHGARASREVASEFLGDTSPLAGPRQCADAVRQANLRLHEIMLRQPETLGMAATIAGASVLDGAVCWFNVGDSRVYCQSGGRLEQLSVDDVAGASGHARSSHALLRSLGGPGAIRPVQPHVGQCSLAEGDRLLLCSDGLWDMVPDTEIAGILGSRACAVAAVRTLLEAALAAGGRDNISIVLIQ